MVESKWRYLKLFGKESYEEYGGNHVVTYRYTILTFLPKFLYEQFRLKSNFFYLSLIILQLSLDVPTDPVAYIVAFSVVMTVSSIKQGYEDWLRHKADDKVNQREIHILCLSGVVGSLRSQNLKVGHIIRLSEDEGVPADSILLASVTSSGIGSNKCEITTANLDGEPNRKLRLVPSDIPRFTTEEEFVSCLKSAQILLEYEEPNADLHKFSGTLTTLNSKPVSLSMENMLLRGTTVKGFNYIYGLVVYTGKDTRLSRNSSIMKSNKFSLVNHGTNTLVYLMLGILFVLSGIATGSFYLMRDSGRFDGAWYLPEDQNSEAWQGVTAFFLFFVFLSYMIPISLSVSIELLKFGGSQYFGWDDDMESSSSGNRALCNTSDLNEELGQINYLLSDKTGTLTENNLKFTCCSIDGQVFDVLGLKNVDGFSKKEFLMALAVCHTVRNIANESGERHYQGESADEETLVATANSLGVSYIEEDDHRNILIELGEKKLTFYKHLVLDFDSDRKAMSVILEDNDGCIFMITKGAESSILPKCEEISSSHIIEKSWEHVNAFAKKGYRTLVVAKKEITRKELEEISEHVEALKKNPSELSSYFDKVECKLRILGVTGVEDELQEGVGDTLRALKSAGIKIWMLTGDKMETAVNVAASCSLIKNPDNIFTIVESRDVEKLEENLNLISKEMAAKVDTTFVMDGPSLALAIVHFPNLLAALALKFSQSIFCRMAPLQKAQIVKLIQSNPEGRKSRICAVGDGGNDVAMIQEANIGIGIMGREGRQAALSADFAVPKFRHLKKAILVHGHWYYYRTATLVNYFFYRGLLFVLPQFFFGFDSGFSGQTVYHSSYMMCYSIMFASVPIVVYGLTEQPRSKVELLNNPRLYREIEGNTLMGLKSWSWWGFILIWHAFIIFYLPKLIWPEQFELMDWGMFSHFLNGVVVAVTNLNIVSGTIYFTHLALISQVYSYGSLFVFYTISSELLKSGGGGELKFVYFPLLSKLDFWFVIVLVCVMSVLPDLVYGGLRRLRVLQSVKYNLY